LRGIFLVAVIDGGVRDVPYLRKIHFPVFAFGIVPSTSVNQYRFAGAHVPVVCDGAPVHPHDVIVADENGVVVPRGRAAVVLALAQQMGFNEHSKYLIIDKYKSIEEAVREFGRL
jgi:4-hydroxy-4-methyl-2-oxoglutarate aldolase